MASPETFAIRAMAHNRELINVLHECFKDLEEYEARGGMAWSKEAGSANKEQVDNLMGVIATLKADFDANRGYFYEAAD